MKEEVYEDEKGYLRSKSTKKLVHREIAYKEIYLKNKEKYALPFKEYIVHHIDGNKKNNNSSNLIILLPMDHTKLHRFIALNKQELEPHEMGMG